MKTDKTQNYRERAEIILDAIYTIHSVYGSRGSARTDQVELISKALRAADGNGGESAAKVADKSGELCGSCNIASECNEDYCLGWREGAAAVAQKIRIAASREGE
jgi:hypothetical protein